MEAIGLYRCKLTQLLCVVTDISIFAFRYLQLHFKVYTDIHYNISELTQKEETLNIV